MPLFNCVAIGKLFLDRKNIVGGGAFAPLASPPLCLWFLIIKSTWYNKDHYSTFINSTGLTDSKVSRPILGTGV